MLDGDLTRIGLALDEPAPMRVQVCASRCLRYLGQVPELTRANDALLTIREIIFNVFINATWDPGLDREQILRELFIAVRDEVRMYDKSQSYRESAPFPGRPVVSGSEADAA